MHRLLMCVALVSAFPVLAQDGKPPPRGDVSGTVRSAGGDLVDDATVMVWTAGVKEGYSTYCPSCYPDCGKQARTDSNGRFTVPSLDGDLLFRLLVVAEGFEPTFVRGVDPLSGEEVGVELTPREAVDPDSGRVFSGRIVDAEGEPIAGAAIEPDMVYWLDEEGLLAGQGGAVDGLEPLAISNADGEFTLMYKDRTTAWRLRVSARAHARRNTDRLATDEAPHTIVLTRGGTLTGRLLHEGRPVPNVLMGVSHVDRTGGRYLGNQTIGTDSRGRFTFENLPAGVEWFVYGTMNTIKDLGATPVQRIRIDRDEQVVDIGDVEVVQGFTLSGQVILTDGSPIPPGMRIAASHHSAWDSQTVDLPADGRFTFTSLPAGDYSISPAVRGYRLSPANPHLSWSIEGLIDRDVKDFVILLDPGKESFEGRYTGRFNGVPIKGATPPPAAP